jgi:hypothetical protein
MSDLNPANVNWHSRVVEGTSGLLTIVKTLVLVFSETLSIRNRLVTQLDQDSPRAGLNDKELSLSLISAVT